MIRKQIHIDNEQDRQVKNLASNLGISKAEVIRRAITNYMLIIGTGEPKVICENKEIEEQMEGLLKFALENLKSAIRL